MALILCSVLFAAALVNGQTPSASWTPLFDGRSLKGWNPTPYSKHGAVTVKDGAIHIAKSSLTGITFAGSGFPKSNYEIRFEATRVDGNDFFAGLTFPVKDSFCTWINGGWGGSTIGLSSLDHNDASENDTSTVRDFVNGRWYAFRLAVTDSRIQAWMDKELIIDVDITKRLVTLRPGEMDLSTPLGFATYWTEARLRKIEFRRLPK